MTAEILALLEEGPQDQAQLADVLAVEPNSLRFALKQLKAAGQVKRTGVDEKWALVSYSAPNGRRPDPDPPDLGAAVVALLAAGPKSSRAIAQVFNWGRTTTYRRLLELTARGAIKQVGVGRLTAWALPSYIGPPPEGRKHTPWQGSEFGRTHPVSLAEGSPRRQPGSSAAITSNTPPSWWVSATPDGFTRQSLEHQKRMREAKENRFVPFRMLQ